MAERRVYVGSNMAEFLPSDGISREAIDALMASGASSSFRGRGSMLKFEDAPGGTPGRSFYQQMESEEAGDDDLEEHLHQPEKKRRLRTDQVQSLERSFETENKLEPERKLQLARELGLQPRQVAIWFQNRRARWKTKQLEKDYEVLQSSYSALRADYEAMAKEKEKLRSEVNALTEKILLKENGRSGSLPCHEPRTHSLLQRRDPAGEAAGELRHHPLVTGKQEDLSAANSGVLDGDSPPHSDRGWSSPAVEPTSSSTAALDLDNSDLSPAAEDDAEVARRLPNFGFAADHSFWLWPSY